MQEAKRMTHEAQERAQDMAHTVEVGFEAASRSLAEANRGFQTMAAEITNFSRRRLEDVMQSWQQLLGARSLGDVVEVQSRYFQRAYDDYMSEMSKLGEMYLGTARNAAKPVQQSAKRFT